MAQGTLFLPEAGEVVTLPDSQRDVLETVIKLTKEDGCAPTYGRIRARVGSDYARAALLQLRAQGFVTQPYKHGPYLPVRTAEGTPLELRLVEVRRHAG